MKTLSLLLLLTVSSPSFAQQPAPAPAAAEATPVSAESLLNTQDKLERENVILTARIAQLEGQLAQATQQLRSMEVQNKANAFVAKIKKDYAGKLTVDPDTLELKVPQPTKK